MNALERANAIRLGRAEIKRQVGRGDRGLIDLIEDPPDCVLRVPLFELIQWSPRIGKQTARKLTRQLLTETLPLESAGARTKGELVKRLSRKPKIAVPR